MTKFDSFMSDGKEEAVKPVNQELLFGTYGCQSCELYTSEAYFNSSSGEITWFCDDDHKSTIAVG